MNNEFRNPVIYLMSGKAKHGKDTFSNILKEEYESIDKKVLICQLSKYIKDYARVISSWDGSEETKPRELLQKLGTDLIRKKLQMDDLFVKRLIDDILVYSYFYDVIIISDVRFKKEIIDIKNKYSKALAVKIFRPNFDNGLTEEQKRHPSEVDLDDYNNYDIYIENNTLEELRIKAKKLVRG